MGFKAWLEHSWNVFRGRDHPQTYSNNYGYGAAYRPDRNRLIGRNEKSIINAIFTRISIDVASVPIKHVRLDDLGRFSSEMRSRLNECLTLSANKDQTGRAFVQDIVMSTLDEGYVAVVPVDTSTDPYSDNSYEVESMRVGKIVEWFPDDVRVDLYNDRTGKHEYIRIPKKLVAIIENPFYSVMNEPNSTLSRLSRKLALLDLVDEQSTSGRLDLIIQLPYTIRSEAHKKEAERRRKDIEMQLSTSKLGVAYTDATEKIVQLNRPLENNLLEQINKLTDTLYSQLGIPPEVFKGTADEATRLNYINSTIEPILSAIVLEFNRKFLTKTARTKGQSIMFFTDPFKLMTAKDIASLGDALTRNAIMSSNELRSKIGLPPVDDPDADTLRNKNLNQSPEEMEKHIPIDQGGGIQNEPEAPV